MHDAELVAPLGSAWPRDQEHNKPQYLAHYQRFGRAVRSVYDQQPVKPSNVSAALSLIMLARLGAALGAARAAAPFPPPSARREGGTRLRKLPPSLPSSLPCL